MSLINEKETKAAKFTLKALRIETTLGPMMAIGDDAALYFLGFEERLRIKQDIERLKKKTGAVIIPGICKSLASIQRELSLYFEGKLTEFQTPIKELGTAFQLRVWKALRKIGAGETRSYYDVAASLDQPTAVRAVARANATNLLVIITPCHRVINKNGELGGYGGGLARKKWLLQLENRGVGKKSVSFLPPII